MEILLLLALMLCATALFATEKVSVDLVALLLLSALMVSGLVTMEEGISGFSNPATITVGAMFILSAGLKKTGALSALGRQLFQLGKNLSLALLAMVITVGGLSAFINNTAAVAVLLPLVLSMCARRKIPASRLLIPLSYASQLGGVCTLIGTSTNLLVNAILERSGHGSLSMFEFTPLGLIMMGTGIVYFFVAGPWLLPSRGGGELTEAYGLQDYLTELHVMENSPLVGKTVRQSDLAQLHDVTVLEILRKRQKIWSPWHEPLREGDILLVRGSIKDVMELKATAKLEIEPDFKLRDETLRTEDLTLVETMVPPRSRLIGKTLIELDFWWHYNTIVLAIKRHDRPLHEKLNRIHLRMGDVLLLQGRTEEIDRIRRDEDFLFLSEVEQPSLRVGKAPVALGIITLVIGLAAMGILPILITAILGCVAMVLTRCISMEEAYASVDWKVLFLMAGVIPLGIAMDRWGAAALIASESLKLFGRYGPAGILAVLYIITAVLTEFMSNNASAILLTPIAISTAAAMGVDPKPFVMAICYAASTSFSTPVGYQTNTMIYSAGAYRFSDFMKAGIPLNLILWGVSVYFIPILWPF